MFNCKEFGRVNVQSSLVIKIKEVCVCLWNTCCYFIQAYYVLSVFARIVQFVIHTSVLVPLRKALEGVCVCQGCTSSSGCLSWHFIKVFSDNTHSLKGHLLSCSTRTQLHTHIADEWTCPTAKSN